MDVSDFTVDIVIPWVDGSDIKWQEKKRQYTLTTGEDDQRFRDFGTLKYLLRSIDLYAEWVNKIFLITDNQTPEFLNENPKVVIVDHSDYIPKEFLPTFNSNVIEYNIWRIPNLSEHFILLNDDLLFVGPTSKNDFFSYDGKHVKDTMSQFVFMPSDDFAHTGVNNIILINQNFSKKTWLKDNWRAALSFKNGFLLTIISVFLSAFPRFTRFFDPHVGTPYLKSAMKNSYKLFQSSVDNMFKNNKTREITDVSVWLVRYFQILTGLVEPKSYKFGKYLEINDAENVAKVFAKRNKKLKMIVLNDKVSTEQDFLQAQKTLSLLKKNYEAKSQFEK